MYRKMIKQAERVMANFVVRCLNGTLGKGFYTWRDNVFEFQRQQNVMRRSLLSLLHSQYRPAFTKWRDYVKWASRNEHMMVENRIQQNIEDVNMSRLADNDISAT